MPWHVQFYLHTLKINADGSRNGSYHFLSNTLSLIYWVDHIISNLNYIPAIPRARPTTFQSFLVLPAKGRVELTMEVAKAFLRYTEHPPDAQRGWDLPPAVFILLDQVANSSRDTTNKRIYSSTLLVDLATPDFSMPYNVIIFTCSLIAFLFGSIFNLITRKFAIVRLN